jgi:hypothetical protein
MKTQIALLFLIAPYGLYAQEKNVFSLDAKKISQTETPVTVLQAVSADFPASEVIDYYLYDDNLVSSEWVVTEDDKMQPDTNLDYYSVLIKGKDGGYAYGLYDKNGKLMSMKLIAENFALPPAVASAATTGKYAGYKVKSDKFVRIVHRKTDKEYLEVLVEKGNDVKKLYFSPDGKLIKAK